MHIIRQDLTGRNLSVYANKYYTMWTKREIRSKAILFPCKAVCVEFVVTYSRIGHYKKQRLYHQQKYEQQQNNTMNNSELGEHEIFVASGKVQSCIVFIKHAYLPSFLSSFPSDQINIDGLEKYSTMYANGRIYTCERT